MKSYQITYNPTGEDFGTYFAESFFDALEVMARKCGYADFAEYSKDNDVDPKDLQITLAKLTHFIRAFDFLVGTSKIG
jgi:hypothetical protein